MDYLLEKYHRLSKSAQHAVLTLDFSLHFFPWVIRLRQSVKVHFWVFTNSLWSFLKTSMELTSGSKPSMLIPMFISTLEFWFINTQYGARILISERLETTLFSIFLRLLWIWEIFKMSQLSECLEVAVQFSSQSMECSHSRCLEFSLLYLVKKL